MQRSRLGNENNNFEIFRDDNDSSKMKRIGYSKQWKMAFLESLEPSRFRSERMPCTPK